MQNSGRPEEGEAPPAGQVQPGNMPGQPGSMIGMSPYFIGSPWVPRFKGTDSGSSYGEWKAQIKFMLSSMPSWTNIQQSDFIIGALDGEARREVVILTAEQRSTPTKIFKYLDGLYGDNTPLALLRGMFFDCRQRPGESVRAFSLRCRELFQRLKDRDADVFSEAGQVLRDQFIMGLQDPELRRELNRMIRRREVNTFEQAREEAIHVEDDRQSNIWQPPTCAAVRGSEPPHKTEARSDWKTELKMELLSEVRVQMKEMQRALLEELRPTVGGRLPEPTVNTRAQPQATSARSRDPQVTNSRPRPQEPQPGERRGRPRFQWDAQGRPICTQCQLSGHIARFCTLSEDDLN